jgi:hypothetical protein
MFEQFPQTVKATCIVCLTSINVQKQCLTSINVQKQCLTSINVQKQCLTSINVQKQILKTSFQIYIGFF